jgi:hypothetical protein
MTSSSWALGCALFLVSGAALAQRSAADIESARQLYNQGISLREKGDLRGALEKFRAAHALGNTPITGIDLCKAHAAVGQPVEAREACLGVGRIPPIAAETQRSQDARREAARIAEELKSKLASIRVHVRGTTADRPPVVTVDGATVPPEALGEARAVDPGEHVVVARVGKGPDARVTISTREGEQLDVELTVTVPVEAPNHEPTPTGAAPPPPVERQRGNALGPVGFIAAGVFTTVGIVTGAVALNGKSDLDGKCPDKACGPADYDRLDSARTWGTVSTVTFILGGASLLVGLYGTFVASKPVKQTSRVTPVIGPLGAGVHGTF